MTLSLNRLNSTVTIDRNQWVKLAHYLGIGAILKTRKQTTQRETKMNTIFTPELNESPSNIIVISHSAGSIWTAFWSDTDSDIAKSELSRFKINPKKMFSATNDEYQNPWNGSVKNFVIARLTTKQVEQLIASSKIVQMQLNFD